MGAPAHAAAREAEFGRVGPSCGAGDEESQAGSKSSTGFPSASSLDLSTARAYLHLVAKANPCLLQLSDETRKIRDLQHDPVPAARLLLLPIRHRPRARRAWTAEQDVRATKRDVRKRGELLVLQLEPELLRIERYSASDVFHLIANAVNTLDE